MRLAFLLVLVLPSLAHAQLHIPAISVKRDDLELRIGERNVSKRALRCVIERYQGDWAWIRFNSGDAGWVKKNDVVPMDQAIDYFTSRISAEPRESVWHQRRATVWQHKKELDLALADISEAIRLSPNEPAFRNTRGNIYKMKHEYSRAIADYNEAIRLQPGECMYWISAGNTRGEMGDYQKALDDYVQAIRLDPKNADPYDGRAWIWLRKSPLRDPQKAVGSARRACELSDWQHADYIATLAFAYEEVGDYQKALDSYAQASRLDPKSPEPYNGCGWLWATCKDASFRDGPKAVECARRACELSDWRDANKIGTLAAAYAETGDFDSAIKFQKKTLQLLPVGFPGRQDYVDRLQLFEAGQPLRE